MNGIKDAGEYCRQIEAYLCHKNAGHLIRIVGPAFEQVCGWAAVGVPLKLAFRGIDRYCERYYAKGLRRRPVRIEFCEADILEMFDDWRRAVGVAVHVNTGEEPQRRVSLASHIERAAARLAAQRSSSGRSTAFAERIETALRELDKIKADAQHARGDRRRELVASLEQIDRDLLDAARGEVDPGTAEALRREAEMELAPFSSRMPADATAAALAAAFERLLREAFGLPILIYE